MQRYNIIHGDVLAILKTLPADYFDATLSDPPYGISFMCKEWDKGVPSSEVYAELLRVLKPGAMGLHFGGTRMWHRLAVNLEDAGFELRDTVMWLYGSGFPKSHNISKAIDKNNGLADQKLRFTQWMRSTGLTAKRIDELTGTNMGGHYTTAASQPAVPTAALWATLRPHIESIPAWVDELVARIEAEREVVGSQAGTLLAVAPGQDNDRAQTTLAITAPATPAARIWDGYGTALKPAWEPALLVQKPLAGTFANNALTHGCGALNVDGCRVELAAGEDISVDRTGSVPLDTALKPQPCSAVSRGNEGRFPANLILDEEAGEALGDTQRFFYCAKVSTKERNAGCEGFEVTLGAVRSNAPRASEAEKFPLQRNNHPTLKPLALTEYLARLLLIPARTDGQPRRILVPFSGAGSELIGALQAGWDEVWGIELAGDYIRIAAARIEHHTGALPLLDLAAAA